MRTLTALAFIALSATACEDIESADLLTNGMSAIISGEADGTGSTEVVAVLRAGGIASTTFIDLTGTDSLVASTGETEQELQHRSLGTLHSYATTFDVDPTDAPFTVRFDRDVDAGAPSSTFTLPAPFAIDASDPTLTPDSNLNVSWSPSGTTNEMEVVVSGNCVAIWAKELDGDPGAFAIPGSELNIVGDEPGAACPIEVTVRRISGGSLDAAFGEGGLVQGIQSRTADASFSNAQ